MGLPHVIPAASSAYGARRATHRHSGESEQRVATAATRSAQQRQRTHTRQVAGGYVAWQSRKQSHS